MMGSVRIGFLHQFFWRTNYGKCKSAPFDQYSEPWKDVLVGEVLTIPGE